MSAATTPISLPLHRLHLPLAMAVALALGACSQTNDSPDATTAAAAPADQAGQPDLARLDLEELRNRGRLALREQRIYAPAGNNAMEYYIALRDGSKTGDDPAASALMELQPYAVIAAEQALERKDFVEAERLRRLVAASDPRAPSLARIASAIAMGLGNQAQEASEVEPPRAELVAVRTPPPEYPNEKRPRGAVGQVVASFTVNSDGSVGDIRTESLGSKHLAFERSVERTVKRWKYQPPGESRDVTVSFDFAP